MAADVETAIAFQFPKPPSRLTVGPHDTNRAGYENKARFPCIIKRVASRYAVTCRNKLGDQFIYRFTSSQHGVGSLRERVGERSEDRQASEALRRSSAEIARGREFHERRRWMTPAASTRSSTWERAELAKA